MDLFKSKIITYIITSGVIISVCIGSILYYIQLTFNRNWFLAISVFFLITETLLMLFITDSGKKQKKKQMVNHYMLTKVIKVITSLVFITVYVLVVKENIKSFVGVFITFYLLYLIVETILFIRIEKYIKEKTNNND